MTPVAEHPVHPAQTSGLHVPNRNFDMHLMQESLARAHMQERIREAERQRLGARLARADRLRRKAERASLRARRALAAVLM